eukprot:CAMPEP_0194538136 /NCGR_PEP_ID=MMETSP0253-20130528/77592_1 /TAXON_ID=2966 /ORGANISM="Noctiluca scintillans" /LENGTH=39 /DNA_ID= /DNA_START= /DNA_END= /DNA_ORIENTATION=
MVSHGSRRGLRGESPMTLASGAPQPAHARSSDKDVIGES